jgi:formate dehydrogenase gamma subunit
MANDQDVKEYRRFSLADRIEHWVLVVSFTTLGLTGLIQKYSASPISEAIIAGLGGIENVRVIHRVAATLMMLEVIYHLGVVGYRVFVLRQRMTMLPTLDDARNALQALMYNVGLRDERPLQGRYTFEEKAEYWALVWGTLIMTVTGFILWNPIATARFLPGEVIPAALAAHGGEALLAVLAIIIWHFYGVHVRIFNKSIFTGTLSEEEMEHEHPLELARIKAGLDQPAVNPQSVVRRRRTFFGVFSVLAVVMVAGIIFFITFEETAITTVPPIEEDVVVFAPLTPTPFPTAPPTATPLPTAEPGAALTWGEGIAGLFEQKCVQCHSDATSLGGLNTSSYEALLAGGDSGPGVVPGAPGESSVVTLQEQGGHAGQFTEEELSRVRQWIEEGAPEG